MKTFEVTVTSVVQVKLDERAFTPEFYKEFIEHFFPFDTLELHAQHIAQLAAREVFDFGWNRKEFVEGYGEIGPMGIYARVQSMETVTEEVATDPVNLQGSGPAPIEPREG
ncbi:hypothetical protein [Tianweitania sediminis]|uniref:Uncharacterized protein n=1 Tax=Tianweitania sediminis TaxID=1502156 RepID=A0A8J7R396_9HYPH|nr:hypothetical protein [Tianweitania sediminis]MBP0439465.1 hypothetical protein [Tianweitania sediminis]